MALNIFTELYNHHHYLILEHFHHLKKKLCALFLLPVQPWATINLHPVSVGLPNLDVSYMWIYAILGFLCLVSFT